MDETPEMENPLTHESFLDFVMSHEFAVIHFWAQWNPADKPMQTLLQTVIPRDLRDKIAFATFNTDPREHAQEHGVICEQNHIKNVPSLAFYSEGSLVQTVTGIITADALVQHLYDLVDDNANDEIVCEGNWLYRHSFGNWVRIRRSHLWPGTGDYEDPPELWEDREVECYYSEWGNSPDGRSGGSQSQRFATIAEAKEYVTVAIHGPIVWRDSDPE